MAMKIEEFGHLMEFAIQNVGKHKKSKVKGKIATLLQNLRSKTYSVHSVLCVL